MWTVYFLWKEEKLIYIGCTAQELRLRLQGHECRELYNRVTWLEVAEKEDGFQVEQALISRLQPEKNVMGTRRARSIVSELRPRRAYLALAEGLKELKAICKVQKAGACEVEL